MKESSLWRLACLSIIASATLIGRVRMRGFDRGAVVTVRRRRSTAGCSRVKQWSQNEESSVT
jgi:hypothetical protein